MAAKIRILFVFILFPISHTSVGQTFQKIDPNTSFQNYFGYLVLADLDNDGDPEIIQTGLDGFNIFNNLGGTFADAVVYPQFKGESQTLVHTLDVGDINRDGFIDILQSGGPNQRIFNILINTHPGFTDIGGTYTNGVAGASFLGDFEGDGDLDIVFSGADNFSNNNGGILLNQNGSFIGGPWFKKQNGGQFTAFASWCDLDLDSELEVIESVRTSYSFVGNYLLEKNFPAMAIVRNLSITPSVDHTSFADYDGDGDLDMLAKQVPNRIYDNVNGQFVNSGITFPESKTAEFADVNNDGRYDVIIGGMMTPTWMVFETGIYLNQGNSTFSKLNVTMPANDNNCSASLADFDNDGDLDIATLYGIYRNDCAVTNAKPTAPVTSGSTVSGSSVTLTWQAGSDDLTTSQSLTYNIHVRSENGTIIIPGHSLASGKRQIYKIGNAYNKQSFNLSCLKPGTYYWKVQTLDASFQGSGFSAEQTFTITQEPPVAPASLVVKPISDVSIDITWVDNSTTEDEFIIYRKNSDSEFDFSVIDTVAANSTHYIDTYYLQPSSSYDYKIVASNCAFPVEFASEASATTFPPVFVNSNWLELGETKGSMVLLGDYDNDGDLDMLLSYEISTKTKLFRFDGTVTGYVDTGFQFPFVAAGATWVDYNNDGYIDIYFDNGKLYRNQGAELFVEVTGSSLPLPAQFKWQGGVSWGDYDNDGDEDILVQSESQIHIYDNNGKGQFLRNVNIGLAGHVKSINAWADYDRDGDLDILANRKVTCTSFTTVVYENSGNKTFSQIQFANLPGLNDDPWNYTGDMEWGDYNNDGYPDILVSGQTTCGNGYGMTKIYRNNGNKSFTPVADLVREIYDVDVDWGDYDNDGDLDVFSFGDPFGAFSERTRVYRNDGNTFVETNIDYLLKSQQFGKAARGDIDQDGDLDYVILGELNYVDPRIIVYRNTYAESWGSTNDKPSAPLTPMSNVTDQAVRLSWSPSLDAETTPSGLTYNVYIMDETDSVLVNSYSMSNGNRKIVGVGNGKSGTELKLKNLKAGTYRWAVQAIDKGFKGSSFSEENSFVISAPVVTGVEKESERLHITFHPNPTADNVTITVSEYENNLQFVISSSLGQRLIHGTIDQQSVHIDLSKLPAGLYFVTIFESGSTLGTQKIIKK